MVFYLVLNILETRSRCSICSIFVFHIFERQEIEAFSKVNFTNLNASIKSGFPVFKNYVFLFTNAQVLQITFTFIINE